jgi:hypothetical protein
MSGDQLPDMADAVQIGLRCGFCGKEIKPQFIGEAVDMTHECEAKKLHETESAKEAGSESD